MRLTSLFSIILFVAVVSVSTAHSLPDKPGAADLSSHKKKSVKRTSTAKGYDSAKQAMQKAVDLLFIFLNANERREDIELEEKQRLAREFVRYIRWGYEKNYYFWITDLEGKIIVEPLYPQLEGKNCLSFKDKNQKQIFVDFINIATQQGRGFINHHGKGYDDSGSNPMISFLRLFKIWGWVVGTRLELVPAEEPVVAEASKASAQAAAASSAAEAAGAPEASEAAGAPESAEAAGAPEAAAAPESPEAAGEGEEAEVGDAYEAPEVPEEIELFFIFPFDEEFQSADNVPASPI